MTETEKYRLLTRSDFDGLVCAILLKELDLLESIRFVHPKDVQDGRIEVTDKDILTNLPYVPGCHLCFDHHDSEDTRAGHVSDPRHILQSDADSAARVLYNFYGGAGAFPHISEQMMESVDQADSARFSSDDILDPQGWVLLSFLMDARTGLGRFKEFRVSNYQLMMDLINACKNHTIEEILALPDVQERVKLYRDHHARFVDQIRRCTTVYRDLAVLDLRKEPAIYVGNRFMIYALFPQCSCSMHVMGGHNGTRTVFAIGKSILNRTCTTMIGDLALRFGGGGHDAAGTCQVENEQADVVEAELIARIIETADARASELMLVG